MEFARGLLTGEDDARDPSGAITAAPNSTSDAPHLREPSPGGGDGAGAGPGNLEEKRVSNARIKSSLGVQLRFPSYREGLAAIHAGDKTPFD